MKRYFTPFYSIVFGITFLLLSVIQVVPKKPLLLLDRFVPGLGWVEVIVFSILAVYVTNKLINTPNFAKWRKTIWFSFTVFFFLQLILGLVGIDQCLMSEKLHFPIPAMILGGPLYRGELTFMVFLFIGTVIVSGPAWCSQLCYFGSLDLLLSGKKSKRFEPKNMYKIKYTILVLFILIVLILKILNVNTIIAIIFGTFFGITSLLVMIFLSKKHKRMIHCTYFCPIGSIVTLTKWINPFRIKIDSSCDQCMKCTLICKYNALNIDQIKNLKPGITCTNCGDCLSTCHVQALQYQFFNVTPENSRRLYLATVVIIFTLFFAVARI